MEKSKRAKYGQFNTSLNECKFTLNKLKESFELKGSVLEPSFGTGNFITELKNTELEIDCFEIDPLIFKPIEGVNCYLEDFLMKEFEKKYNFIVGNPPYIEVSYSYYTKEQKTLLKKKFNHKKRGRVNLIHFFMDKSFELLEQDGVLAYLLPTTILSSPWYNDIREKIYQEYTVIDIVEKIPFKEVSIDVCLLILQKKIDKDHSFIKVKNQFYTLTKTKSKGLTLKERGFECQVGSVLWYKNKEKLSEDPNNKILVYSNNIGFDCLNIGGKLKSKIPGKKQFIVTDEKIKIKNCIIMPRVISKKMKFTLIENNENYLFENHVMTITHPKIDKLRELYNKLISNELAFQEYFNSTNITISEILNFEY